MTDIEYKIGNDIHKGSVIMTDSVYRVVDVTTAKPGKHGVMKVIFTGIDLFTGKKSIQTMNSTDRVAFPKVTKKEYQVVDYYDDYITILDKEQRDIQVTDQNMLKEITKLLLEDTVYITIQACGEKEKILSIKTGD